MVVITPVGEAAAVSEPGASRPASAGAAGQALVYRPPVDGPVIDPFREPAGPYGPGNRGLEYATAPGTPVRAIGPGIVVFAGPVAGRLVISVAHPDGLRSSYTGLGSISAQVGDVVRTGAPMGVSAARLHLGVRRAGRYLDPALLFGSDRPRRAVLVPLRSTGSAVSAGPAAPAAIAAKGGPLGADRPG